MTAPSIDHCFPVDVRRIVRMRWTTGVLQRGPSSLGYDLDLLGRRLTIRWASAERQFSYVVELAETRPHFGGRRWWGCCPRCPRRVGVLHVLGVGTLGCRVCLGLAYESTRDTEFAAACRRARRIRAKLSASGDLTAPFEKPKGMHWRTFFKLAEREKVALGVVSAQLRDLASTLEV